MMVLKFGGSSLATPSLLKTVVRVVQERRKKHRVVVVVSACGKTTNRLLEIIDNAVKKDRRTVSKLLSELARDHFKLLEASVSLRRRTTIRRQFETLFTELETLLEEIMRLQKATLPLRDQILSFGERISSLLVTAVFSSARISAVTLDALKLIRTDDEFGSAHIELKTTQQQLRAALSSMKSAQVGVMGGFIGATAEGIPTTLGRGGSDVTAAVTAEILHAKQLEIWSDVDGVMTADPRVVCEAFTIPRLSYAEARELASFGAKVIHPQAVAPVERHGIPLLIKNTLNPKGEGTLISKKRDSGVVKGITAIEGIALVTLAGSGMIGVRGIAGRMFTALARCNVNAIMISQGSSEQSVCCAVRSEEVHAALKELKKEFRLELKRGQVTKITQEEKKVIIAVVGEGMRGTPGVAGRLFSALGKNGVNVVAVAQGASEINISFAIEARDCVRALNVIHGAFHLSSRRLHLFVVGKGTIGGKLLDQIAEHHARVLAQKEIDLRVIGIADSKHFCFNPEIINLKTWRKELEQPDRKMEMATVTKLLQESGLENLIFVDATASDAIPHWYPRLLSGGISIVTPNKKANTQALPGFQKLMAARAQRRADYAYETSVGAGLPIISTLRDLIDSGDEVKEIHGVFSGTLSFIFSRVSQGERFSIAVRDAMKRGLTEPDPRIDLSGEDVARKILILARELGKKMELADIAVDNLIPTKVRHATLEAFLRLLPSLDDHFGVLMLAAEKRGKKLQYCARVTNSKVTVSRLHRREVFVGITEIAADSPLTRLKPGDNMVILKTRRYDENPLIVQGPGAGPDVTAAGIFADILRTSKVLFKY